MTSLRTERLILRDARPDDAPSYALGMGEYDVARFLAPVPWPYSLAMAVDWLRQAPAATPDRSLLIIDLPDRGLIGSISLLDELGLWIARPYWGRGYATEAAAALLDWHFAGTRADRVLSSAQHDNAASLAVQKKLGFEPVGRQMRFSHTLQHNVPHILGRLTRADWLSRAATRGNELA